MAMLLPLHCKWAQVSVRQGSATFFEPSANTLWNNYTENHWKSLWHRKDTETTLKNIYKGNHSDYNNNSEGCPLPTVSKIILEFWRVPLCLQLVQRFSRAGPRGRGREWATLGVHPLSWLLSNNRLEEVCNTLTKGTFSSRLLLSNRVKGCSPSVAHSLPLPLGPALLNLSSELALKIAAIKRAFWGLDHTDWCLKIIWSIFF